MLQANSQKKIIIQQEKLTHLTNWSSPSSFSCSTHSSKVGQLTTLVTSSEVCVSSTCFRGQSQFEWWEINITINARITILIFYDSESISNLNSPNCCCFYPSVLGIPVCLHYLIERKRRERPCSFSAGCEEAVGVGSACGGWMRGLKGGPLRQACCFLTSSLSRPHFFPPETVALNTT